MRLSVAALPVGLAAAATAVILLAGGGPNGSDPRASNGDRPNIVVLLTDDQETRSMSVMKTVAEEMKREGVTMRRFYDNFPLCCPARATLLTGQFAHNHGVLANVPPAGGYGRFDELHGDNYLPIWLQQAGYRTAYVGKFMNGYAEPDAAGTVPTDVPRGWDDWYALAGSRARYFNYRLNQNGRLRHYGDAKDDYSTRVFTDKARRLIRAGARGSEPFFLELGYVAPHTAGVEPGSPCDRAATPAPGDLGTLGREPVASLPKSFNEADVSDKPSALDVWPALSRRDVKDALRQRECAAESLLDVDRSVGEVLAALRHQGILDDTYVFFLSDNGYLNGEHRIRNYKRYLYEESARVPFVARGPGIPAGETSDDVVVNADLTATILELSGATPGLEQDGRSLMPSLRDPTLDRGRAILLEAYAGDPTIKGLRTSRYLYAEWETGPDPERELYDMNFDPQQLDNVAHDPAYAPVVARLHEELGRLADCSGPPCQGNPDSPPAP